MSVEHQEIGGIDATPECVWAAKRNVGMEAEGLKRRCDGDRSAG